MKLFKLALSHPQSIKHGRDILEIHFRDQTSQLGKKFDSKVLPLIFASSKAFRRQKFSFLLLLAARFHD